MSESDEYREGCHTLAAHIPERYVEVLPVERTPTGVLRCCATDKVRDCLVHLDVMLKLHWHVTPYRKEFTAHYRLEHPSIVTAYDFFENEHIALFASEWVEGDSLALRIRNERPQLDEALQLLVELAGALATAASGHLAHRDLRPSRILLRKQPGPAGSRLAVRGFGFAPDTTWSTDQFGFAEYNRHLLYAGDDSECSDRTDTYCFGVLLFELISGNRPFDADWWLHTLVMHRVVAPPLLSEVCEAPAWLVDVTSACLEKKPEFRPAMCEVLKALESRKAPEGPALPMHSSSRISRNLWDDKELVEMLLAQHTERIAHLRRPQGSRRQKMLDFSDGRNHQLH